MSLLLPAALTERPFYEEWWFLLVMALVGLILILVLVFTLLLHGQSTKYKACGTGVWSFCSNVSRVDMRMCGKMVNISDASFLSLLWFVAPLAVNSALHAYPLLIYYIVLHSVCL